MSIFFATDVLRPPNKLPPNVQNEGGGVNSFLNNVKKNCMLGIVLHPLAWMKSRWSLIFPGSMRMYEVVWSTRWCQSSSSSSSLLLLQVVSKGGPHSAIVVRNADLLVVARKKHILGWKIYLGANIAWTSRKSNIFIKTDLFLFPSNWAQAENQSWVKMSLWTPCALNHQKSQRRKARRVGKRSLPKRKSRPRRRNHPKRDQNPKRRGRKREEVGRGRKCTPPEAKIQ